MRTMQAALMTAPMAPVELTEIQIADPRVGEVLVRVHYCGLCHSDLSFINGHMPAPGPVVLGHEAAGIVEEVGPGVTSVSPGDKVILTPLPNCGHCYFCLRQQPTLCSVYGSSLMTALLPDGTSPLSRDGQLVYRGLGTGAFAEYTIMPEVGVVKVDEDVPLDIACVLGCAVQTGVGAVLNTAKVEEGATVLVMGAGGIGLAVTQGARIAGASTIVVSDPVEERREAALRFGATHVVDPSTQDVQGYCLGLTGVGMDYCFESAGVAALIELGVNCNRPGGTTVCVGAPPLDQGISFPMATLFAVSEKKLLGCLLGSSNTQREVPRLLGLWKAGRLDLEAMVTQQRPLAELDLAVEDMRAGRGLRTVLAV